MDNSTLFFVDDGLFAIKDPALVPTATPRRKSFFAPFMNNC